MVLAALLSTASALSPVSARARGALAQSGLVGELEGITIVTDPAEWPTSFEETSQLAELVEAAKLPPVEQRLPRDHVVIQPVREIVR